MALDSGTQAWYDWDGQQVTSPAALCWLPIHLLDRSRDLVGSAMQSGNRPERRASMARSFAALHPEGAGRHSVGDRRLSLFPRAWLVIALAVVIVGLPAALQVGASQ